MTGERNDGPSTAEATSDGGGRGRPFHHGDLPGALVATATSLISERRGPNFSLREVAECVGVSHTAAYRHFAAKADLLAEVATRGFDRLDRAMAKQRISRDGRLDVPATLRAMGFAYIEFAERHVGAYRVMFLPELCDTTRHPALTKAASAALARLADVVRLGCTDGSLRDDLPPPELAAAIWAAQHGHAVLLLDGQIHEGASAPTGAPRAARAVLIETILAGVLARPKP